MPTLDLRNSTLQELFDAVVAGAREQEYIPATSENGDACQYRGVENRKCHFGHLIPDNVYDPEWDRAGMVVGTLRTKGVVVMEDNQYQLTSRLQNLHDDSNVDSVVDKQEYIETGFREIAQDFDLVYTPPEEKKS